jgi:Ca2+-binding RTX toxin-like protein
MPIVTDHTALLGGNYWNGIEVTGRPVIVTYSFPTSAPAYDADIQGFNAATVASFQAFTADQQNQARAALADWAAACGIVFVEVAPGQGDINFQIVDLDTTTYSGAGGVAFEPFGDWDFFSYPQFKDDLDAAGDVFMNSQFIAGGVIDQGTLLHEIGHALGLKHPTEVVTNFAADPDIVHDQVLASDDPALTIMATVGGTAALKQLDLDAVAFLYGASGGAVVTADASGSNAVVSSWSWTAAAQTLTQVGFDAVADTIRGSSVIDVIDGLSGDDRLFGLAGADTLTGGLGNDHLFGGSGADDMTGGDGDDAYYVDDAGDAVHELPGQGFDSVYAFVSVTLAADVELLQLFGDGLTGTGNGLGNSIFGDGGFANTLNGAGGTDYIVGGGAGDTIDGGTENDSLFGGDGGDSIAGGGGDDTIDGGLGADAMGGGTGGDTYVVDNASDSVSEALNAGIDIVNTTLNNYSLFAVANVERILFTGAGNFVGRGNGLDNRIEGGAGNDRFVVDQGGADRYFGGTGVADTVDYRPSAVGAIVNLTTGVHGGAASGDFFSSIEYFYGSNTAGDDFTGAGFNDRLDGYGGNDVLRGLGGNDTIMGGDGDDEIAGGALLDFLWGNAGADDFNYADVSDSGPSSGARDRIYDFVAGADQIDVSAIDADTTTGGDDAFTQFLGGGAFTAAGQVRWYQAGANTVIEFNTAGASGAEMQIQLQGFTATNLTAADFIA